LNGPLTDNIERVVLVPVYIKTIIFTIIAPGSVTILFPHLVLNSGGELFQFRLGIMKYAGHLLIIPGVAIYLRCAWDFTFKGLGTPAPMAAPVKLVKSGLYRFSRNPMYVGVLSIVIGESIFLESSRLLIYCSMIFILFQSFIFLYEEPHLRREFGDSYNDYCSRANRWVGRRS